VVEVTDLYEDRDVDVDELPDMRVPVYTFALDDVPQPGPWHRFGACREAPTSLFFIQRGESTAAGKAICAGCGVRSQCLDYAVAAGARLKGIWGGTAERDRERLRAGTATVEAPPAPPVAPRQPPTAPGAILRRLEVLREHEGRWAVVATYASPHSGAAVASLYRGGRRKTPAGCFEFEGRMTPEGGSALYARYLGTALDIGETA
jgi:WhiB family redox-sensing transcriptional regulator